MPERDWAESQMYVIKAIENLEKTAEKNAANVTQIQIDMVTRRVLNDTVDPLSQRVLDIDDKQEKADKAITALKTQMVVIGSAAGLLVTIAGEIVIKLWFK